MIILDELEKRVTALNDKKEENESVWQESCDLLDELESDISYVREEYFRVSSLAANDKSELKNFEDIQSMLLSLNDLKLRVIDLQNNLTPFDKCLCLKNIRTLLKKSDIKIGQIENRAHVRPGYLSILEKESSTSEPSIRFLATAAKMLKVSLDDLIYTRFEELSEDEQMINDFLTDVLDDTLNKKISWETFDNKTSQVCSRLLSFNTSKNIYELSSGFYPGVQITLGKDSYHATLPNTGAKLYIFDCRVNDKDDDNFFEIYLGDGNKADALLTTLNTKPQITALTDKIVKAAGKADAGLKISDETKGLILKYRSMKKEENYET